MGSEQVSNKAMGAGAVVLSKLGRDKGNYFICVKVLSETEVLIADGRLHKLNKPKKKNVKHVKMNGVTAETIREKLLDGRKIFDSEMQKFLKPFNEAAKPITEGEKEMTAETAPAKETAKPAEKTAAKAAKATKAKTEKTPPKAQEAKAAKPQKAKEKAKGKETGKKVKETEKKTGVKGCPKTMSLKPKA